MKTEQTVPMLRVVCETCGAAFGSPSNFSERIREARLWGARHAAQQKHDVYAEKSTGTMYRGSR